MIENDKVIVLHSGKEMADFLLGALVAVPTAASKRVGDPSRLRCEFFDPFMKGGVFGYLDDKVIVLDLPPSLEGKTLSKAEKKEAKRKAKEI